MKTSPHPWKLMYATIPFKGFEVLDANGRGVARVPATIEHDAPNAKLIRAAPELLEALKLVWDKVLTEYHSPDSPIRKTVEEAIANAER